MVIAGIAVVAALLLTAATPAGASTGSTRSPYLAGYHASGQEFKYVTTQFTVPSVNCNVTPNSEVWHYAGLGTPGSQYYFQAAGLVEGCSGGSPYYQGTIWNSWLYGTNGHAYVLSVNPGDTLTVSVFYDSSVNQVNFKVVDNTQGTYWEGYQNTDFYNTTAEVFTRGNLNNAGTADFGQINFGTIKVTLYSQTGSRALVNSAWTTYKYTMYGPVTALPDVQPSTLYSDTTVRPYHSSFTNTWLRNN